MPSAPNLISASSLSSDSLYFNTTSVIDNGVKQCKITCIIKDYNYNNQITQKHVEQERPSIHIHKTKQHYCFIYGKKIRQHLEKSDIVKATLTTTIKGNLMQTPLSNSKQEKRQMQYNQQVNSNQDNNTNTSLELNHLRKRKIFGDNKVNDFRKREAALIASHIQRQESKFDVDEVTSFQKTSFPLEYSSAFLNNSTNTRDLNIKYLKQKGSTNHISTVPTNNIIISYKVKCQVLNSSLDTASSSEIQTQTSTKIANNYNKKPDDSISNDKINPFSQPELTHIQDYCESNISTGFNISTGIKFTSFNCPPEKVDHCEEVESVESSLNFNRLKSIRRSSLPKFPKCSKPQSPVQNSEADLVVEPIKKRFSYCSSCSSCNSCNCDITGENSNTLYEGFGIGVVVSNSYTDDDCVTGSGGIASSNSVTNGHATISSSFRRHSNDIFGCLEINDDRTSNASQNCSDFEETYSEPPSLVEYLSQAETEYKILRNNLKHYSRFHEELNKQIKEYQILQLTRSCVTDNSDLKTKCYKTQNICYRDQAHNNYSDHNIYFKPSNNSLNFNMNFDISKTNNTQTDMPSRTGLGTNNEATGTQIGVGGEVSNFYASGGGIPNIPETMNGTTLAGGANQQKTTGSTVQKRPQRRGGKQQPDRPERALFCLTLKNPVRSFCIRIVDSNKITNKKQMEKLVDLMKMNPEIGRGKLPFGCSKMYLKEKWDKFSDQIA